MPETRYIITVLFAQFTSRFFNGIARLRSYSNILEIVAGYIAID